MKVNILNKNNCKGIIFRGYSSIFFNSKLGKLEKREGFNLLKRKSCNGKCNHHTCSYILDIMDEMIDCEGIIYPEQIENNKLYSIKIVNERQDWETGIVDDFYFEFYKIVE